MTTSVSRRLNIVSLMFEIISFFIIMLFSRLYVRLGILLKYGNDLHNRITSLRREACERKTRLAPPFLIEVPSQENERANLFYTVGCCI
jgi:hypothetical protein